ncbi:uncharacterized protein LOC106462854 [Limulus polyphemus]|uniref:Uncharacterized protein LOC106462854 n=1 Tax=Limulus polyphemus TaxID=6850 RepID=A0ABM1BAS9_LIMPO|nr:uncharacterized protein LOC106462854 [Limulus polyphemus]
MKLPAFVLAFQNVSQGNVGEFILFKCSSYSETHISRRWLYVREIPDKNYIVTLEAPFMKMKEIHLEPEKLNFLDNRLAEAKKEEGNALYKKEKYREAIPFYSEAIARDMVCKTFKTRVVETFK